MAEKTLTARFKQKVDTSTNWAANNPILLVGEIGCESDTFKIKVGDGSTAWNELSYVIADVTIDTALDESSSNAIANSAATAAINENAANLSDFIDISAGRIVTDADTGYIGEIFNDYENNVASGSSSHAEGLGTTASGNFGAHAEGEYTTASSYSAHAEGGNTKATGQYSHAEGRLTQASASYSHAEGSGSKASGLACHAEGFDTQASGYNSSHAEGFYTVASGNNSHAEGYYTVASGEASHASGRQTTADQNYQTAIGMANIEEQEGSLFVVGNGTYNNSDGEVASRSNAFEVFDDASVRIGNEYSIKPDTQNSTLTIAPVDSTKQLTISLNGGTLTYDADTNTINIDGKFNVVTSEGLSVNNEIIYPHFYVHHITMSRSSTMMAATFTIITRSADEMTYADILAYLTEKGFTSYENGLLASGGVYTNVKNGAYVILCVYCDDETILRYRYYTGVTYGYSTMSEANFPPVDIVTEL